MPGPGTAIDKVGLNQRYAWCEPVATMYDHMGQDKTDCAACGQIMLQRYNSGAMHL